MRKIILFNMMTLNGFFEGLDHDIGWHKVDEEFNQFAIEQLDSAGGLIFGRVTYQMMAGYWPTQNALKDDPAVAQKMNSISKFVFSRTLSKAEWANTTLVKGDAVREIPKLKQQPGKDLFIFGSADLAAVLTQNHLLDEYRVIINPILIGSGTPLFKCVDKPVHLKLTKTRAFSSGNMLLFYQPVEGMKDDAH